MFENCYSLHSIPDISKWNTKNIIDVNRDFENCFKNCISLISIPDISKWKNMKNNKLNMFDGCFSLLNKKKYLYE